MHSIIPVGVGQNGLFDVVMGGMGGAGGVDSKGKGKERGQVEIVVAKAYNVSLVSFVPLSRVIHANAGV